MDHLIRPLHYAGPAIRVPYVAREDIHPYSQRIATLLTEKPKRVDVFPLFQDWAGFSDNDIRSRGWVECTSICPAGIQKPSTTPKATLESFLQEWLFFGLLREVLHDDYQRSDFIDEQSRLVVTTKLPSLLWNYKERFVSLVLNLDDEVAAVRGQRAVIALTKASKFFNAYLGRYSNQRPKIKLDEYVVLSVGVMIETLCGTYNECTRKFRGGPTTTFTQTWPPFIDAWLLQNQWCPNTLGMLERRGFGPQGMLYAAMLGPLNDRDHSNCHRAEFECKANLVEDGTYKGKHNPPCHEQDKNCYPFRVNATRICEILEDSDSYPVLEISSTSDRTHIALEKEVLAEEPYVALSHVWMDGLGNPLDNALPVCQIKRLCDLVNSLPGKEQGAPARLWIDTLCVPTRVGAETQPSSERRKKARDEAIGRMDDVYRHAEAVIILDANIFASQQAMREASDTEVFMRLMSTNWMRRLWTLLEGVLSHQLYIAFPDGIVNIHQRASSLQRFLDTSFNTLSPARLEDIGRSISPFPGEPVSRAALQQFVSLRAVRDEGKDQRLASMWNNMLWRSTSWQSDETICMAILLGFPKKNLTELSQCRVDWINIKTATPEAKRVQKDQLAHRYKMFLGFLCELKFAIPRGLLFIRTDRCLSAKSGWAPNSFFSAASTGIPVDVRFKGELIKDQGMYLSASGFELYLPPTKLDQKFVLIEEPDPSPFGTFYSVDYSAMPLKNPVGIPWSTITSKDIKDPAIIVSDDAVFTLQPGHISSGVVGVMVSIIDRREELYQGKMVTVFHATYLARVWMDRFDRRTFNWAAVAVSKSIERADAVKNGLMRRLYDRRPGAEPQPIQPPLEHDPERFKAEKNLWKGDAAALNFEFDGNWAVGKKIAKDQIWCIGDALQPEGGGG